MFSLVISSCLLLVPVFGFSLEGPSQGEPEPSPFGSLDEIQGFPVDHRGSHGGRFIDTFYDTSNIRSYTNVHRTSHGFMFNRTGFMDDPTYLDDFTGAGLHTRWKNGTTEGGSGANLMVEDGNLKVSDFGVNGPNMWHGPFISADVSTRGPFIFETGIKVNNAILNEIGRINISLLNETDDVVFTIVWQDLLNIDNRASLLLMEGTQELFNSGLSDSFQSFNGDFRIERIADEEIRFAVNDGNGWYYQNMSAPTSVGLQQRISRINISAEGFDTHAPLSKCWFTHVSFIGSLYTSGSLTSNTITLSSGFVWDHLFVDWETAPGCVLELEIMDGTTWLPVDGFTTIIDEGEVDISPINATACPVLAISVTFTGNGLVTPRLISWGISWVKRQAWQDNLFEGMRFSDQDSVTFGSGVVTLSRPDLYQEDFTSEPTSSGWSLQSSGSGSVRWTTSVYSSPLYSLFMNEPENSEADNDARASVTVPKPSDDAQLEFSAMVMNTNVKKYNLISYRAVLIPEYSLGDFGQLYVLSPSGPSAVSGFNLHFGDWHHFSLLFYSSSNTVRLTIDGVDYGIYPCYPVYPDQIQVGAREDQQDFGSLHIDDIALKGSYSTTGSITSVPIPVPSDHYFNVMEVDKEVPPGTKLTITALDGGTGEPIPGYSNMDGTSLNLSGIDPTSHPWIMFRANLTGGGGETPILRSWSIDFLENQQPVIVSTESADSVLRGSSVVISFNATDPDQGEGDLIVDASYMEPSDPQWRTDYITRTDYESNHWEVEFEPPYLCKIGTYTIRIRVTDIYGLYHEVLDTITVVNNPPPGIPFFILPSEPTTLSDLEVLVRNREEQLYDIEGEPISLEYQWYKNGVLQPGMNISTISHDITSKGDTWKCTVVPNDGHEDGPTTQEEVNISNHAPVVITTVHEYFFKEDDPENILSIPDIFGDPDGDAITVTVTGNQELSISVVLDDIVVTSKPDWHGSERLTLTANDSEDESKVDVVVYVENINDVPSIQKVGNTSAVSGIITLRLTEDERFYADTETIDADNDTLSFYCNRSEEDGDNPVSGFGVDKATGHIEFLPVNDNVGTLWAKLTVFDMDMSNTSVILKMEIENTNDPPQVNITRPEDRKGFSTEDRITFRCKVDDPDTSHSQEEFSYIWRSSLLSEPLGEREVLNNIVLEEGDHLINVTVMDSHGAMGYDEITVIVVQGGGGDGGGGGDDVDEMDAGSDDLAPIFIGMVVLAAIIGMILGLGLRIQETRGKIKEVEREEVSSEEETDDEKGEAEGTEGGHDGEGEDKTRDGRGGEEPPTSADDVKPPGVKDNG